MKTVKYLFSIIFLVALLLPLSCAKVASSELVDLHLLESSILVDLKYATEDNFTGQVLYDANRCLLRRGTAERLIKVQKRLIDKGYGLKVWDGYRPRSVQWKMWKIVQDPKYVADPRKGSRHNRGASVDVTLVDREGNELAMPTAYDDFSPKASRDYLDLPSEVITHRKMLEDAMVAEGFIPLPSEWWHFDDPDWENYDLLDVPLSEIRL